MESSAVADETAVSLASHPLILPDKDDNASFDQVAVGAHHVSNNKEQLRQQPQPPPDQETTITCPVCYDDCTLDSTPPFVVSTSSKPAIQVNDCGHTFCHECLLEYCEYHISMRKLPVSCPMMMTTSSTTAIDTTGSNDAGDQDRVGDRGDDSRETADSTITLGATKNHWRASSKKRRFAPRKKPIPTPNSSRHDFRAHHGACPTVLSSTIMQLVLTRQAYANHNNGSTRAEQSPNKNEAVSASALWIKYQRLQRLLADPSLVECTRCSEVVSSTADVSTSSNSPTGAEPSPWSRSCPGCQHVFCALHGDAHLGRSCDDPSPFPNDQYDVETSPNPHTNSGGLDIPNDDDDDDTHHTDDTTKPCSHCHVPLHKYAGCDHVVCPACHGDMCFRCGTHVHLSGTMARYCAKCQQGYLDHRYIWRIRLYYCLFMPLLLPLLLMYMAVALLLIVLTGCCCCCFCCGNDMKNNRDTTSASNNNANESDNNNHHQKKYHPGRGVAAVSGILLFPTLLILFDMGWQVPWFDDWLDGLGGGLGGCTNTPPDVDGGGTTNDHTARQLFSMEEGGDNESSSR